MISELYLLDKISIYSFNNGFVYKSELLISISIKRKINLTTQSINSMSNNENISQISKRKTHYKATNRKTADDSFHLSLTEHITPLLS